MAPLDSLSALILIGLALRTDLQGSTSFAVLVTADSEVQVLVFEVAGGVRVSSLSFLTYHCYVLV
jgi:hypothetical protein